MRPPCGYYIRVKLVLLAGIAKRICLEFLRRRLTDSVLATKDYTSLQ